jgi:hypothetical protein
MVKLSGKEATDARAAVAGEAPARNRLCSAHRGGEEGPHARKPKGGGAPTSGLNRLCLSVHLLLPQTLMSSEIIGETKADTHTTGRAFSTDHGHPPSRRCRSEYVRACPRRTKNAASARSILPAGRPSPCTGGASYTQTGTGPLWPLLSNSCYSPAISGD